MKSNLSDIASITKKIIKFRDARDWKKFHNPKDSSLSLVLEAAEVMEHFQWKNKKEMSEHIKSHKKEIAEELADVMYWIFTMSHELKIDIAKELENKLKKNERRYPIKKAKGNHKKYTELK